MRVPSDSTNIGDAIAKPSSTNGREPDPNVAHLPSSSSEVRSESVGRIRVRRREEVDHLAGALVVRVGLDSLDEDGLEAVVLVDHRPVDDDLVDDLVHSQNTRVILAAVQPGARLQQVGLGVLGELEDDVGVVGVGGLAVQPEDPFVIEVQVLAAE